MVDAGNLEARLLLGALLFGIWGGLRYSDLQRCDPAEIQCLEGFVYAWIWKSKSNGCGFPVAVACCGFTGQDWTAAWLRALQDWRATLPAGASPDFLVPAMSGGAMAYSSMPACCDGALWLSWKCR